MENADSKLEQHMQKELAAKSQLLKLEYEFVLYYTLVLKELQAQKKPLERLFALSRRYLAISSTEPQRKRTKIEAAAPADAVLLQEFNEKIKLLRASCHRIMHSNRTLVSNYQPFKKLCAELDMSVRSPFMTGDTHHKPIGFFIEQVSTFIRYFSSMITKLNYRGKLLDIEETKTLANYKALLVPSKDFEEVFHSGLTYMKCLRPRHVAAVTH